jgi:hypothetical protein
LYGIVQTPWWATAGKILKWENREMNEALAGIINGFDT